MTTGNAPDAYERDSGLAAERTELAWGRSTLAVLGCGAAVLKGVPSVTGSAGHTGAGVVVLVVGALVWLAGVPYARARASARAAGVELVAATRHLAPIAVGTAVVGLAAFIIGLFRVG